MERPIRTDQDEREMIEEEAALAPGDSIMHFTMRLPKSVLDKIEQRAVTVGFNTKQKYIRALLIREVDIDPDDEFTDQLIAWWVSRGRGDRGQIDGAILRAKGAGMTFAWKFRTALKQMLDHGLI